MWMPFLITFICSLLITPLVIKLVTRLGLIDDPARNPHPKVIHTYPVPRGGGLAIFLAFLIATLLFLPFDKLIASILIGGTLITILGLLDDKYNLNPYLRILLQTGIAAIPILAGIGISYTTRPFGGMIFFPDLTAKIISICWIVFLMNILNMGAKGVDGQLPGVVGITAITIALLSLRYSAALTEWPVIILAVITAGAYFGFLPWNTFPQKIMPAFGGSTLAGYLLGILSILSTAKVGTLIVALGIPLVDTGYVIVRRIITGKSPVWGDRGHLHHRLLDAGWSKRQVAGFYWGITALLGFAALNLNASQKAYTIVGVAFFVGGLLLWLTKKSINS